MVTALFADIKGSMDLMEGLDSEEARSLVDPALKFMMDAVHHYDGYIVQSTGDGIFALFGAPVASVLGIDQKITSGVLDFQCKARSWARPRIDPAMQRF
jgi:class 3 adenylate cyclase